MNRLISRPRWLLACGCVTAVAGLGWAATYNWAGLGANTNWATMGNWGVSASYPGSSDDVFLDDTYPADTPCVYPVNRTVRNLFIGDGMNLDLKCDLISTGSSENGKVEFQGAVVIKRTVTGTGTLTGDWMVVFSTEGETAVTTDSSTKIVIGA